MKFWLLVVVGVMVYTRRKKQDNGIQKFLQKKDQIIRQIDEFNKDSTNNVIKIDQQQKGVDKDTSISVDSKLTSSKLKKDQKKVKTSQQVRFKKSLEKQKSIFGSFRFKEKRHNVLKPSILSMRLKSYSSNSMLNQNQKNGIQTQTYSRTRQEGGFVMRSWMKFLEQSENGPKQLHFMINNNFFQQAKSDKSDDFGSMSIPDELHFFMVVTNEYLFILASRVQQIMKAVASYPLRKLLPQADGKFKGGVEDLGDFKEGFCFKLQFLLDRKRVVVLCADSMEIKQNWMNSMVEAKKIADMAITKVPAFSVDETVVEGESVIPGFSTKGDVQKKEEESDKKADEEGEKKEGEGEGKEGEKKEEQKIDGKWIQLQDWSSCTLACGGGTQSLHRECQPPKNGGAECEGEAVITRPCNEQPCPEGAAAAIEAGGSLEDAMQGAEGGAAGKPKVNEPMVRLVKVSEKFQIYERCLQEDTDIDVVQEQLTQFQIKPRIPGRAIMNNRTITVYMRKNINSAIFSAPLNLIKVEEYKDAEECFRLRDTGSYKSIVICGFRSAKEPINKIKQKWVEDIKFFQLNCFKPLDKIKTNAAGGGDPLLDLKQDELNDDKAAAAGDQAEEEGDVVGDADTSEVKDKFKEMQDMAVQAIQKELNYENLLEAEEKQKIKDEQNELAMKLEKLAHKQVFLSFILGWISCYFCYYL